MRSTRSRWASRRLPARRRITRKKAEERGRLLAPAIAALGASLAAACTPLPEAESAAARLYATRCGDPCHRVYVPSLMKYEMWKYQVGRMQDVMRRNGFRKLTREETTIVLDYLKRHSG